MGCALLSVAGRPNRLADCAPTAKSVMRPKSVQHSKWCCLLVALLSACSQDEYQIAEAASDACAHRIGGQVTELARDRQFIDTISVQGGVYSESGSLLLEPEEFRRLVSSIRSNASYTREETNNEVVYINQKYPINRCYGTCRLSKSEAKVSYRLRCS